MAAVVARRPAESRPPHFQAKVRRCRSSDPIRVSTSVPATGGSCEDRFVVGGHAEHGRVGSGRSASGWRVDSVKPDASPTARALLALELVQGSPGITADRLADKLGVSERAARRYVGILREAGIPIESVRGPYGGYRLGRGLRLPPLMFSAAEALGLVMAVLDGHHDASDPTDPVGSALGKIMRALPEPVAAQAEAVRRTTAPAPDRAAARPDPGTTTALVQACSDHRRVRLGYRSEAGSEWVIEVDPWAVVVRHGRWYLLCRSHTADARRAYRIDRVRAVEVARRHLHPTRRPRPGRHARGASRRRMGVRRRGRHRRARRHRGARLPRALGPARAARCRDQPAGRQHQQPGVVRRAARGDPGVVPDREVPRAAGGRARPRAAAAGGGCKSVAPPLGRVQHAPLFRGVPDSV